MHCAICAVLHTQSSTETSFPCTSHPQERDLDLLLTAETHNFPCAVAPYPGAETGAGGRIRDTHATGRGSLVVAATAGYWCAEQRARKGAGLLVCQGIAWRFALMSACHAAAAPVSWA